MTASGALVLEILKQDNQLAMSVWEQKELASTIKRYSQLSVSFAEIEKLCDEITAILNKADKSGVLEGDLIRSLKNAGQLLWGHLFTRQVKEELGGTQILDLVLTIDEELIHIPWELLYDGREFLCLKFNLGRLVRTKHRLNSPVEYRGLSLNRLKMLILANPTNDLKSAYLEGVFIKNQFDRRRKQVLIDFKSTRIDALYVKKAIRDYDIVHFAGHCEYDSENPASSGWVLNDGRFTARDILALGETFSLSSLVFSNACYSAKMHSGLMDADYQGKAYSLAAAFLFSGTRLYIGTIRRIEDLPGLSFAKEFYANLISGKPVGQALRLSRLKLIRECGINSIAWMSYLLYGDPNFVLFRAEAKPLAPKLKRGLSSYKKYTARLLLAVFAASLIICLYTWLPTINPDTYALFIQSRRLFTQGANREVIALCSRIIEKDPKFLAVYPLLADTYQRLGKREQSLSYYFAYALNSEKRRDKKNLASAYIGVAWTYHLQGGYLKAFDFYNQAIALCKESGDKLNEALALRKLAVWYIDKDDNDKALELLMKSSEINRARQHIYRYRYNLACDYFDIGLVFSNKNDFTAAREFYDKSRSLFEKLKLKAELSDYYFNLGEIHLFEKQYQKALDCYLKGLKIDQAQGNIPAICDDYNMLGELYLAMDNLPEAERAFQQALLFAGKINGRLELAAAAHNLGLLYKKKNQKNKAREFFRQAQEIYHDAGMPAYEEVKQELLGLES